MVTLAPSPRDLGLHSPVIGPWFSDEDIELGLAEDDLAVPLTLGNSVEWRPPVAGLLSFAIAATPRPPLLATLRSPTGPAFTDGRLIAVYEVLPEAGERLAALMRAIPTLGNPALANVATRPPVRYFALEFTDTASLSFITPKLSFPFPVTVDTDDKKLAYLGLGGSASAPANGAIPMRDLYRPGVFQNTSQFLLKFDSDTSVRLWAFDHRGRALDPGAVACWWLFLATQDPLGFEDLFAEGVDERTAPIANDADRLLVQLVNAHEGPLDDEALARIEVGGNAGGDGALRFRGDADDGAIELSFSDPPSGNNPDDLPIPRMAVLPDGRLDTTLNLFEAGPVDPILVRDHARVVVVSVEHHLTGQPRHTDATDAAAVQRAEDQNRNSTRILVDRSARPALLTTNDEVAAGALAVLALQDGGVAVNSGLVAPVLSVDWGPLSGTPADVAVPTTLTLAATALTGGGSAAGSTIAGQRAMLTVDVGAAATGAWVRCWTQGFDNEKGERFRLDGGSGLVDLTGQARVVVPLADGDTSPNAQMGVDILVVTARGRRLFADQRFPRPAPIGGNAVSAAAATGPILLCEEGREVATIDAAAAIRSGTTAVALGGSAPALVDPSTIPASARDAATYIRSAAAGDTVRLTQPAFRGARTGDGIAQLAAGGATVRLTARVLPDAWQAGFPLPGMERRELLATATNANTSLGIVGGGPALGTHHGLPPHAAGHPLTPAGPDMVGAGVRVQGPGVRGLAEYVRERVSTSTIDLVTTVNTADIAVTAAPAADSLWVAGLRTVAAGVEAEVGLGELLTATLGNSFPFGDGLESIRDFLSPLGITIPASINDPANRIARALDRRFLASARGAREGARSLIAAIRRAEDFVYIETPAIDDREFGPAADRIHLLDAIRTRMDERPGLRVLLCLPVFFDETPPRPLQRIRDQEARSALDRLAVGANEARVAVFSPSAGPGRTLKQATTSVIVDDAWAMVGTTHLWRRGLSFDSSYAATVYDDRMELGRPQEILAFRRRLVAQRLGLAIDQLPDDPVALVDAARLLATRGGSGRVAPDRLKPPQDEESTLLTTTTFSEVDVWNPDGSPTTALNPIVWALQLLPAAVSETFASP